MTTAIYACFVVAIAALWWQLRSLRRTVDALPEHRQSRRLDQLRVACDCLRDQQDDDRDFLLRQIHDLAGHAVDQAVALEQLRSREPLGGVIAGRVVEERPL